MPVNTVNTESKPTFTSDTRPHWFFVSAPEQEFDTEDIWVCQDTVQIHHMKTVMRLRQEEPVVWVDAQKQQAYLCQLCEVSPHRVTAQVKALLSCDKQSIHIIAAVALIKGPRWDWMLQKLTELGVSQIVPLQAARCVVKANDKTNKRSRWETIVRQAAEQSEQVCLPVVTEPVTLSKLGCLLQPETLSLVAVERQYLMAKHPQHTLRDVYQAHPTPKALCYVIGPEGGWTESEVAQLTQAGYLPVSLGSSILRSETAAITLAAIWTGLNHVNR